MFRNTYHKELEGLRKKAGYQQVEAADAAGIPRRRWNDLEKGRHGPRNDESRSIEFLLGPILGAPRPPKINRILKAAGAVALPGSPTFQIEPDRPSRIRFLTARRDYPDEVNSLAREIAARADFEIVDHFYHQLSLDSSDEAMFVLHLLNQGASPALIVPGLLPSTPCPIIDPRDRLPVAHRPMHCLVLAGAFHFFQVSFATPRTYTVDVLRWNGEWNALEIDGRGHDSRDDDKRTEALPLPVRRIPGHQLRRLDFRAA